MEMNLDQTTDFNKFSRKKNQERYRLLWMEMPWLSMFEMFYTFSHTDMVVMTVSYMFDFRNHEKCEFPSVRSFLFIFIFVGLSSLWKSMNISKQMSSYCLVYCQISLHLKLGLSLDWLLQIIMNTNVLDLSSQKISRLDPTHQTNNQKIL